MTLRPAAPVPFPTDRTLIDEPPAVPSTAVPRPTRVTLRVSTSDEYHDRLLVSVAALTRTRGRAAQGARVTLPPLYVMDNPERLLFLEVGELLRSVGASWDDL